MRERLLEAFAGLGNSIITAAPKVVVGILLVILSLVVAKVVEVALRSMLVRVHFYGAIAKIGIDKALHRIGFRQQMNLFLPKLAYFLIILLLVKTASDAFSLIAISDAIGAFFSYLPNLIAALLLLVLGSTVGQFAGQMVTQAAENSGIDFAPSLGKLVSALIVFIVAMMAIGQLKIDTQMVRIVTAFVLAAGALAFGLAFGLGTREIVKSLVVGFYARKFLVIGKRLEIAGQSGVLTAITATHTILDSEGQDLIVSNSAFMEQASKQ